MGLFDEIQKALQEAIDEAQQQGGGRQRPRQQQQRRAQPQPQPQPPYEEEEAEEHELESALDRKYKAEAARKAKLAEKARARQQQLDAESARAQAEGDHEAIAEQVRTAKAVERRRQDVVLQTAADDQAIVDSNRIRRLLASPQGLRDGIVLREILDKPVGRRRYRR